MVKTEEEKRQYRLERYWKNPEKYRKRSRESAEKNKESRKKYQKKWREENREYIHLKRIENQEEIKKKRDIKKKEIKTTVMAHYSKKLSNSDVPCCNCCGENQFLIFLTIDHIKGWKNYHEPDLSHRKGAKRLGGKELYRYLQKNNFPSGYQVLCMNCNAAKSENEVCPHQRSTK
tara:strand:+ start:116 stop:640 length:525 start_codon:yes stop_codon:yes gene_type:complete